MHNHNPFSKTNRPGFLLTLCLLMLSSSLTLAQNHENTTEWTMTTSNSDIPVNTQCDRLKFTERHRAQAKNKEDMLFPPDGGVCLMREYFSDEDSPLDAKQRIRHRFSDMVAGYAGYVIGKLERYESSGSTIDVMRSVIVKAMVEKVNDKLPIVSRKTDSKKPGTPWLIEVHAKALIPRVPLEDAVEILYKKVTDNEREKRKLMEEVKILRGVDKGKQEKIERLERERWALIARDKTLSAENQRLAALNQELAQLKRERRIAEKQSSELQDWYQLRRHEANNVVSPEEVERRMKAFCRSEQSLIREKCREYQLRRAFEEQNIGRFVDWAKSLGAELDPWDRHLLGLAYWRYDFGSIEDAKAEMSQALTEARKLPDFDAGKLRKMHYNLALLHAARGEPELGLQKLEELGKTQFDQDGFALRAVLNSRVAQGKVCPDLYDACDTADIDCTKERLIEKPCVAWCIALNRGDCRADASDASDASGASAADIGLAPDGGLLPLGVTPSNPFDPAD
uniref:Tetratricopeptide repeat-containing protein n=1 Tax=Candidatus Kentrum sp. MB TaxID=2138164 RepID=A0A451BFF8_9GAMM|nr:MAG: hypothetical protein BECKMB1821G_GA0114241_10904 [Candidatus Kentron sp. MB]VFK34870.1 MAG: hypothetical protein BECKMB1821I_GA0114274_10884 [Candidatus Kentron sp. MB]VFK77013.1 MAG: hypothetical protein BECKMB1821H_GA0114242_10904 [Candidatus Kentron sp. MB]